MNCRTLSLFLLLLPFWLGANTPREVYKQNRPALCRVQYYKNVSSNSEIGSYIKLKQQCIGIIVSADGLVMVNSTVYPLSLDIASGDGASFSSGEPTDFKIILSDGREFEADFVGKDDVVQAAFLKINDALVDALPFVRFSETGGVEVGQPVYLLELLGEAMNFEGLFTPLYINAVVEQPRRRFLIKNQVTALSAGGLLLSESGDAIGVTLQAEVNYEFMMPDEFDGLRKDYLEIAPSEWLLALISKPPVLDKSQSEGKAWLGIGMQALTPELAGFWDITASGGIVIDRIYHDSPADKAGLKVRDVIIEFDGEPIEIARDEELNRFKAVISQRSVNSEAPLAIFRDGKVQRKKIKFSPAPASVDQAEKFQLSDLGIEVRELTQDVIFTYDFPVETEGVYIYQVDRAAPAGLGGLEVGTVITHINGKPVHNLDEFRRAIETTKNGERSKIMFRVQFRLETMFVFVDAT